MTPTASFTTSVSTVAPIIAAFLAGGAIALYATTRRPQSTHRAQFTVAVAILALAVAALQIATLSTRNAEGVRSARDADLRQQVATLAICNLLARAITQYVATVARVNGDPPSPRLRLTELYVHGPIHRGLTTAERRTEARLQRQLRAADAGGITVPDCPSIARHPRSVVAVALPRPTRRHTLP